MRGFFSVAVYLVSGFLVACGSSAPTAPTPTIPIVAGSYAGTVTIVFPEIPRTLTCPATTAVTQAGSSISIAPIALSGVCGAVSIPAGPATIDATGNLGVASGSYFEPSCSGSYTYAISGGFFGRDFRFSMTATSAICLNYTVTATLTH